MKPAYQTQLTWAEINNLTETLDEMDEMDLLEVRMGNKI